MICHGQPPEHMPDQGKDSSRRFSGNLFLVSGTISLFSPVNTLQYGNSLK
jgi:hypothetical protein